MNSQMSQWNEWIAIKDPASGRPYYGNQATGVTQWEIPSGFVCNSQLIINMNKQQNHNSQLQFRSIQHSQTNIHQAHDHIQNAADDDVLKWNKAYDPASHNYYWWHSDTKETRWKMPSCLNQSMIHQLLLDIDSDNESSENDQNDDETSSDSDLKVYNPQKLLGSSLVDDATTDSDTHHDEKIHMNDDEILVNDVTNVYWNIAANGSKYPLTVYAIKHFQTQKHSGIFSKCDVNDLVKCAPYNKVKHALLQMNSKLDKTGQQIWKNINSYMLLRKSSKSDYGHIDKLLRFALKAPTVLRDEIFCQICKQTHCNPSVESLLKGWKLMSICCSIFAPSDEFAPYLATYLYKAAKQSGIIGEYAVFSLKALDRTMIAGQRRIQPTATEIQRIEQRQPIAIKVYFSDDTFKTLLVSSQTQAQQVVDELSKSLQLNHKESFGLYERQDFQSQWKEVKYATRKHMTLEAKIDGLQYMPHDRELEVNERIMDVFASWINNKKKDKQLRLVFKCKIQSKAQRNSYAYNDWKLAFLSEVWNVVHGMYPVQENDVYHLAAIQLQATHGMKEEDTFYAAGIMQDSMDYYVPHHIWKDHNVAQLEAEILSKHALYKHLDKRDAFCKYIEYLSASNAATYCGCEFFCCVNRSRLRRNVPQNRNIDLVIGISENGIFFIDPVTLKIVDRYKMEEILTYGFRSNAFLMVAGTLMCQRKFQFATLLGKQMNDTLNKHIDLRVKQAEASGFTFHH